VEDVTQCSDNDITLTIVLDDYPEETTWEVTDVGGTVLASGGPYSDEGATIVEEFCLDDACYDFTIYDSYGDGICCAYGNGSYSLEEDATGTVLASGGAFGSSETTNFCLPTGGGGGCSYTTINSNGFENGWGIWNDGGSDCRRNANDAPYASNGTFCARLRDNTNTSVMTTDVLDLSSYDELEISFGYYPRSMDNSNEDFWLQISTNGGSSYTTVEEWNKGDEFENNNFYTDAVTIAGPFTSNCRLRFRCDASGNSDWVYIDDVTISGCTNNFNNDPNNMVANPNGGLNNDAPSVSSLMPTNQMQLFPNPASDELTIAYNVADETDVQVYILDFAGRILRTVNVTSGTNQERINISDLQAGCYLVQLVAGEGRMNERLVVTK
jgi:hypothetical protein